MQIEVSMSKEEDWNKDKSQIPILSGRDIFYFKKNMDKPFEGLDTWTIILWGRKRFKKKMWQNIWRIKDLNI